MKTLTERYKDDPEWHCLVDKLEQLIEQAKFTPSELREACILASIRYWSRNVGTFIYPQNSQSEG